MQITQINHYDINGGAARAAYRIHHALLQEGCDSRMIVELDSSGDWTVQGPTTKLRKILPQIRSALGNNLFRPVFKSENPIVHSPSILPSGRLNALNKCNADVLHMHWVQGEMLSIADIGQLRKPIVWTLHDMWAFCGAEHYSDEFRWKSGYHINNRPSHERGFDLNRWTWERKNKHWKKHMHLVTPSHWLAQCVRESALMHDWPVSVIPNALDTELWKPLDQALARNLMGLPKDVPLLLFGAVGGDQDPRKGFDLLKAALVHLRSEIPELQLVVFGRPSPQTPPKLGFPIHYTGHLYDDLSLRALFSAADVFVLPSRQDNLPNTGVESLACGTPVVAFNVCGLPDIVQHEKTGYLAKAFEVEDLAHGMAWILSQASNNTLRKQARAYALSNFSNKVVAKKYLKVYSNAIASQ